MTIEAVRLADLTIDARPSAYASRHPLTAGARAFKRVLDVTVASIALLLALPLLLVAALAARCDSRGPALFSQHRVGEDGRTFRLWKLRTMHVDNDESAHAAYVAALIRGEAAAHGGVYRLARDPRITRVGRLLRKWSVDELPQLWNVIRGDMSLVGPRPALPREVALYDAAARRRLAVKPGITGLWQVRGRGITTFAEMVELDVAYYTQWSATLELRILLETPKALLSGRGAA